MLKAARSDSSSLSRRNRVFLRELLHNARAASWNFSSQNFLSTFYAPVYLLIFANHENKQKNTVDGIRADKFRQQTECNLLKAAFVFSRNKYLAQRDPARFQAVVAFRRGPYPFAPSLSFRLPKLVRRPSLSRPSNLPVWYIFDTVIREKKEGRPEERKRIRLEKTRRRIRAFKMRYFIVASPTVKRTPQASIVIRRKRRRQRWNVHAVDRLGCPARSPSYTKIS